MLRRFELYPMGIHDCLDQAGETLFDLLAAGSVVQFHAAAFAADEAGFAEGFEVLGERGFWYRGFVDREKSRARLGAVGEGDPGKDGGADRVRQGVKYPFDRD